jgi:thioester reductase-like protein
VGGTKNVIALAKEKGAKLLHISTASVSGNSFDSSLDFPLTVFDETRLYIGQPLGNVYVRSKFESEAEVLHARLDGLDAAVIRVGNLSNRRGDYKFQRNHDTNATLTRLKAFASLGLFPEQLSDFPLEFSPVDCSAKAIIKLAQHPHGGHSVYHAYNHKPVRFAEFADALRSVGLKMETAPTEEFIQAVRDAGSIPDKAFIYEAFINDLGADGQLLYQSSITLSSDFTRWHLSRAGFDWLDICGEYLKGYISYFRNIEYWEGANEKPKLSALRGRAVE